MLESDQRAFQARLDAVCTMLSRGRYVPDPVASAVFFRALEAYPLAAVLSAFDAHVKDPDRGRFPPVPADIIAKLEQHVSDDGRPGPQEAWALAMRSTDEGDTVVWTAEIAEALGHASPILNAGDEVGARMAFLEVYARLVDEGRRARIAPQWDVSLGHDTARRERAIAEAAQRGLIDASRYPQLPNPRGDAPLLLTGTSQSGIPDSARAALLALREWLTTPAPAGESDDARAKASTQRRKDEAMSRAGWMSPAEIEQLVDGVRRERLQ